MQERWLSGVAVVAMTLIPATALAVVPGRQHAPVVHHVERRAPIHHVAARTEPKHAPVRHEEARRAPIHHVVARQEPVRHEAVRHEAVRHEAVRHEPVHHEEARREPVHHVVARHEPVRHEAVRHEPVHHEEARREPVHHVVARHEPVRREPVHHEEARREPVRHEPVRHEPVRRAVAYHPKYAHTQMKFHKAVYFSHWESCVPFARATSGIMLKGNAANWWAAAAGVYSRGQQPEVGSVLNFRATGRMRLGHVSVVTRVVNSREILVDHANWWGPGANKDGISRHVPVIDVSPRNDWTEVRVGLGRPGEFGSDYPTYGFIYDRPDNGVILANAHGRAPTVEVAEAPSALPISTHAIHHSLLDLGGGS